MSKEKFIIKVDGDFRVPAIFRDTGITGLEYRRNGSYTELSAASDTREDLLKVLLENGFKEYEESDQSYLNSNPELNLTEDSHFDISTLAGGSVYGKFNQEDK